MTPETRDPVTDEAGMGSDEARLFAPRNGGPPGDVLTGPGSRNRSEETVNVDEESGEGDIEGVAEEEEEEDLDAQDQDEELAVEVEDDENEELLDGEADEGEDGDEQGEA
ncbi:MAG: hypothetical protein M3167_12455 [Acidobacteriota bacterium]|nr:hypothetical protein [Acidobacteriota bacterium]